MVTLMQWSSLQKYASKFTPKKVYEIDPWSRLMLQNCCIKFLYFSFGCVISSLMSLSLFIAVINYLA